MTLHRPGDQYFFVHAADGRSWRCETGFEMPGPQVGDVVSVTDAYLENPRKRFTTRSFGGELKVIGHDESLLPEPVFLSLPAMRRLGKRHLPDPDYYAKIIYTEGLVYDIVRRETQTDILLKDGGVNLKVSVVVPLTAPMPSEIKLGACVRVRGAVVYSPVLDRQGAIAGIRSVSVLMSGFDDIKVVDRAPWWTPIRILVAAGVLILILLASWIWAFMLRRAVIRQTQCLEISIRTHHNERLEADAAHRERLRLAAELHDGFQQLLAGAMFRIDAAFGALPDNIAAAMQQLAGARDALEHTQTGLRSALWSMIEESEGPGSLMGLFRYAAGRLCHWRDRVFISASGTEVAFARRVRGSLLMVLQEAVGNALRHGRATRVDVTLDYRADRLVMTVADNGSGFDVANCVQGIGRDSMRRRVQELNGEFRITSEIGKGTTLTAEVPYPKMSEDSHVQG
ncbi:MAG: sensor histidine kinase [Kiritimatiellia bacterium]